MRIEDYALIGDLQTSALVGRNGSVDWLCLPRFDSASCFTALLGEEKHGRWLIAPAGEVRSVSRRYREGTLVLETDFETADGTARVIDFMPPRDGGAPQLMRIVQGLRGRVPMRMQLIIRFGYGLLVPWVQRVPDGIVAQAGPDAVHLSTPVELHGENLATVAEFAVQEGSSERFCLGWFPSYERPGRTEDAHAALARTQAWWREWSERCTYQGEYRDEVLTSLIVLKGLTDQVTGAVVAAPTTSLPEDLGGERNWDYRYTWLRDSVLTLNALLAGGYTDEALAFSDAVFRATAGHPEQAQIMYGIAGERRLEEYKLDWLPGYEGSRPVRVGNAAAGQFQLDVYGEVVGVGWAVATAVGQLSERLWRQLRELLDYLESVWQEPDDGMWEARGPRRHYTQSKVMAWLAFDRAIALSKRFKLEGPLRRWEQVRAQIPMRSSSGPTTRSAAPSRNPMAPWRWTPAPDGRAGRPAGADRRPFHETPSTRSGASSATTASSPATQPTSATTACQAARASPGLLVLAGRGARAQRPRDRGAGPVRAAARPAQRPRPIRRGIRRRPRRADRQLPADSPISPSSAPPGSSAANG